MAAIAKAGTHVVIPYRDEDEKRHLKVAGDLGQITSLVRTLVQHGGRVEFCQTRDAEGMTRIQEWDLRRPDQIEECLRHSDIVYNLVGRDYKTK